MFFFPLPCVFVLVLYVSCNNNHTKHMESKIIRELYIDLACKANWRVIFGKKYLEKNVLFYYEQGRGEDMGVQVFILEES